MAKAEPSSKGKSPLSAAQFDRRLRSYRHHLAGIASIIESTLGKPAKQNPKLWNKAAYLLLVNEVVATLAAKEHPLKTADLLGLSKILSDANDSLPSRSGASGKLAAESKSADRKGGRARKKVVFKQAVSQLYGCNVLDGVFTPP